MYKLLVVDDEFNIRDGIANTMPWAGIGVEITGTAVDGEDALEKVGRLTPDIVITDVNMDKMDGLELTDVLRQKYPFIKVIILSGYDEFEYVKRALELRVFSYVMKPVRSKELLELVQNLIEEIEKEKRLKQKINSMETEIERNKSILSDRFLYDLLNGNIGNRNEFTARADFLGMEFLKHYYTCIVVSIPEKLDIARYTAKKLQGCVFGMREIFEKNLAAEAEYEVRPLTGEYGSLTLMIGGDSPDENCFRSMLTGVLEIVVENINKMLDITVSITIGGIYDDLFKISRSFMEASLAAEHSVFSGDTGIIHINDVTGAEGSRYIYPADKEKVLLRNFVDADEDAVCSSIKDIFDDMESQNCSKNRMRIDISGLLGVLSRKAMDMGVDMYHLYGHNLMDPYKALERYNTRESMENWLKNIAVKTVQEMKRHQTDNIKNVMKLANGYLAKNYANPSLSLAVISDYLHLSPSYFSRMYKKETGETYVEALTRIRLEKAKTLLKETNEKLAEISESIGYTDSKYFCTLFKKYLGLTPIEFREA